jgi:PHP family Zn ribbon phosphoesterase
VLLEADLASIRRVSSDLLAEAIRRIRAGQVSIDPGYDGEFGTVKVFDSEEREQVSGQLGLF